MNPAHSGVPPFWLGVDMMSVDGPCPCGAPRAEWHPKTGRCEDREDSPKPDSNPPTRHYLTTKIAGR